jgi:hypothetical protein
VPRPCSFQLRLSLWSQRLPSLISLLPLLLTSILVFAGSAERKPPSYLTTWDMGSKHITCIDRCPMGSAASSLQSSCCISDDKEKGRGLRSASTIFDVQLHTATHFVISCELARCKQNKRRTRAFAQWRLESMRKAQRADRKDARSAKPLCNAAGGGGPSTGPGPAHRRTDK